MAMPGALAAPGTWLASAVVRLPAMIATATTAAFPNVCMPYPPGGSVLHRPAGSLFPQLPLHDRDLRALCHEDFLRQAAQDGVPAVQQLRFRHIDGTPMMRNHHGGEVVIRVPGHRRTLHGVVH